MQISSINSQVKASDISIEKMASNANVSEKDKIAEVSRQFEAMLLRQILSEAQKTQLCKDSEPSSSVSQIYKDMVTTQMADNISRSREVGLSSMLEAQLGRQVLKQTGAEATNNVQGTNTTGTL